MTLIAIAFLSSFTFSSLHAGISGWLRIFWFRWKRLEVCFQTHMETLKNIIHLSDAFIHPFPFQLKSVAVMHHVTKFAVSRQFRCQRFIEQRGQWVLSRNTESPEKIYMPGIACRKRYAIPGSRSGRGSPLPAAGRDRRSRCRSRRRPGVPRSHNRCRSSSPPR